MTKLTSFQTDYMPKEIEYDQYERVKPSYLLRHAQQIAQDHLDSEGFGWERFVENGCAFLLSQISLIVHRPLPYRAPLKITTTPAEPNRAVYSRFTVFSGANGEEYVTVDSKWVLVDTQARRILRRPPEAMGFGFAYEVPREHEPYRLRAPEALAPAGSLLATYSLCDQNGHINNAAYADIAMDLLSPQELERPIRRVVISYHHELRFGQEAQLHLGSLEEGRYACAKEQGKTAFEAGIFF